MSRQPQPASTLPDSTLLGVSLMIAFCILAPLLDASAKLATDAIPVGQITAARFLVQAALMAPVALIMRLPLIPSPRFFAQLALRAALLLASTFSFVAATKHMPIANALAIVFIEPFFLLILGHLFFGNPIGPRRIVASIVGFVGALFVIQPSVDNYGWVALWPLMTAICFALYMLITQAMADGMHAVTQQLHTAILGTLMSVPVLIWANGSGIESLDPVVPQGIYWVWLFGVGFWAAVSHMCMTVALKFAPATTLAPLHYLELVTAVAIGYAIFGDFPRPLTWVGIAIIAGSGLYVVHHERITRRQARLMLPPEI